MRTICAFMLLVNLAFFAWQKYYVEPPVSNRTNPPTPAVNHINRLLLLAEFDGSALRERVTAAPLEGTPNASADESKVICYTIGPVSSDPQVVRIASWLAAQGATSALRESERREVSRFWVYFPPFPSRRAANDRVERMKSESIDDIYVIPAGDMANAVSLGLYTHRDSLERRLTELRTNGYDPSIVPRYETVVAAWFDVEFEPESSFPVAQFDAEFPNTNTTLRSCG